VFGALALVFIVRWWLGPAVNYPPRIPRFPRFDSAAAVFLLITGMILIIYDSIKQSK